MNKLWQWNHVPVEDKWSLSERPGYLRLKALPAANFCEARNSLTQRGIGPESAATAELDVSGLKEGDIAGLALLNLPYAWIGVSKHEGGNRLRFYNQQTSESLSKDLKPNTVYLRAYCNFETDTGYLSYSTDGKVFTDISGPIRMPYQLRTFQGVRYALFNYNERGELGGFADFNDFRVGEPRCESLPAPSSASKKKTRARHRPSSGRTCCWETSC